MSKFCTSCGSDISASQQKFCVNCGVRVHGALAPAPPNRQTSARETLNILRTMAVAAVLIGLAIWFAQLEEVTSTYPDPEALSWFDFGISLMGFGILISVVTLAVQAIVGAIRESSAFELGDSR